MQTGDSLDEVISQHCASRHSVVMLDSWSGPQAAK